MPKPLNVDWSQVAATAVALQSIKAAAQAHGISHEAVKKRARRDKWPVGLKSSVETVRQERRAFAESAGVVLSPSVPYQVGGTAIDCVVQESGQNPAILSLKEKREFLAKCVRTSVGEVDENHPLAQEVTRSQTQFGETVKVKMPGKLDALELDAKLAGELNPVEGRNLSLTQVNINLSELGE